MTDEFRQTLLSCLADHRKRYPSMERADIVKLVFQGMLGVGHLLGDRVAVTDSIAREAAALRPDAGEPLLEPLSPAWCRLNLRRALAEGLSPSVIAGLMLASEPGPAFSRAEVLDLCRTLLPADTQELARIREPDWLPGHSAAYRERYRPAYRVISADWAARMAAVTAIARLWPDRLLVTLDGPCATGKTTLARRLAVVFQASLLHTDDFVIPHAQKTPERLAVPGGNCDAERLTREVLLPWKQGLPAVVRRYDCSADRLLPAETLPGGGVLILEGSYCNLPAIRALADVRLFLEASWDVREARLRTRESAASLQRFYDRWIPLENAYFEACRLPDRDCIRIT